MTGPHSHELSMLLRILTLLFFLPRPVAAAEQGMPGAFIARPSEHGDDQTTDLAPEHEFAYVARDFCELADQLGCA